MAASGQNGIITYAELDLEAGGKGPPIKPPTQETQPMLYTEMSQFQPEGLSSLNLQATTQANQQVQPTTRRTVDNKTMGVSTKREKGGDKKGTKRKCDTRRQCCFLLMMMILLVVCLACLIIYAVVAKPEWAVHLWNQFCEAVGLVGKIEQGEGNLKRVCDK